MADKISLMEIIQKCLDFREAPWNEELYKDIEATIARIDVRERLSLAEKAVVAMTVVGKVDSKDFNPVECAFQIETELFFHGLCLYMTNLDSDIPQALQTMEVYDLLATFGLEDRALQFCGKDFQRLRHMIEESVNFSNIFRLVETASSFSPEGVDKLKGVLEGLKTELTSEKIRELRGLLVEADPAWKALRETLGEEAAGARLVSDVAAMRASLTKEEEKAEDDFSSEPKEEGGAERAPTEKKPFAPEDGAGGHE